MYPTKTLFGSGQELSACLTSKMMTTCFLLWPYIGVRCEPLRQVSLTTRGAKADSHKQHQVSPCVGSPHRSCISTLESKKTIAQACFFVVRHPVLCVTPSCGVVCKQTIPQYGMFKAEKWHVPPEAASEAGPAYEVPPSEG